MKGLHRCVFEHGHGTPETEPGLCRLCQPMIPHFSMRAEPEQRSADSLQWS